MSDDPFSGETNGIPNGLQIPTLGLPGLLMPSDPGCTYGSGSCGGMIYGFDDNNVILKKASDFSAGAGDVLSLGATFVIRKYVYCHCDYVVDKHSGAYITGAVTGAAIGAALGNEIAEAPNNTQIKVAVHEAHHTFGSLGKLAHIQINVWKAGISGSGWVFRIPLPW